MSVYTLDTGRPDLPPCSSELWKPVWKEKAKRGEDVRQLSGRSTYSDVDKYAMIADAVVNLELRPEDDLLDIGCAAGFTGSWFASSIRRYVGVDYNVGALARFGHDKLAAADARRLPFRDGAFSKSYMASVLLCMSREECFQALSEMRRVTRVRGVVADTLIGSARGTHDKNRVTYFDTVEDFSAVLRRAGWSRGHFVPMNRILPHAPLALDAVLFP